METENFNKQKKNKKTKLIWIAVFIVVNALVIIPTAADEFSGKKPELGYELMFTNVMFIVAGFACVAVALFVETLKYVSMMRAMGEKVSFKVAFETAALGKYYDCITPTGAGGQAFQIFHMHKNGYSGGASAAMPMAAFLFMQLAFIAIAIAVFVFKGNAVEMIAIRIPAFVGIVLYSIVPFFILLSAISDKTAKAVVNFFVRLGGKVRIVKNVDELIGSLDKTMTDYHNNFKLIAHKKVLLIKLAILSLVFQVAICSIPFFVLHAYRGTGSFFHILAQTVFIYCAITIIPTPGNAGAAEGSFYLIFSELDYSGLFWGMLIWRFISYYTFIIIGLVIYGVNAIKNSRKKKQNSS